MNFIEHFEFEGRSCLLEFSAIHIEYGLKFFITLKDNDDICYHFEMIKKTGGQWRFVYPVPPDLLLVEQEIGIVIETYLVSNPTGE